MPQQNLEMDKIFHCTFNRTKVELKCMEIKTFVCMLVSFNRTKVELKSGLGVWCNGNDSPFNRTKVELK